MVKYNCIDCGLEKQKFKTDKKKSYKEYLYIDENGHNVAGKRCFDCHLIKQQTQRKLTQNRFTQKYEKTHKGFLMRLYRNMKSRVEGIQWKKHHLYKGKFLLEKSEFYEWAESSKEFYHLFNEWVNSEFDQRLTPSVDRIDSNKGYELKNMRWLTHSQNSSLSNHSKKVFKSTIK